MHVALMDDAPPLHDVIPLRRPAAARFVRFKERKASVRSSPTVEIADPSVRTRGSPGSHNGRVYNLERTRTVGRKRAPRVLHGRLSARA